METNFKYWWLVLIKGIILVMLSIYVFGHPVDALVALALYIGLSLLFAGILLIAASLTLRKTEENWGWQLAEGVLDVIFAIILLSNPGVTAAVFPFVVGIWMIVYGIILFAGAFQLKKTGTSGWWMNLFTGALTVILGYIITSNLLAGAIAITFWLGLGMLFFGILNIAISFRMKQLKSV